MRLSCWLAPLAPGLLLISTLTFSPREAAASCGSTSCPIETHALSLPETGRWSFDLSFQYIDQDQPRIGTRDAEVGEIPSHHDEVRTINRVATLSLQYAPTARLLLGATLPWTSRFHEHIALAVPDEHGEEKHGDGHIPGEPESWSLDGLADAGLQARWRLLGAEATGTSLWLTGGVELPTGRTRLANDDGEEAEVPIQPGSGSTDALVGLTLQGSVNRQTVLAGPLGHTTAIPWFVATSYRRNGRGTDDYRLGEEWQLNAGTAYPLSRRIEALLQLNSRFRGKDSPGRTDEDPDLTGGTFLFASPGLRLALHGDLAGYAYVQIPLYQDVNGLQLTARTNWFAGLQTRF